MSERILLDTGPLVAYLDRRDTYHAWARATADALPSPYLTCESVVSEACFLLQRNGLSTVPVFEMLEHGAILVAFDLAAEVEVIGFLMQKYASLAKGSMSLADACLVRMSELVPRSTVFTLDRHFKVYRKRNRQQVPVIMPDEA